MANDLYITSSATITPYAVVRRKSDAYVWNGTTFVAFVNGDVGNYDIPLTSRGGDFWSADMPTGITSGQLIVQYYDRTGASPAITDVKIRESELYWGGTSSSPSGSIPTDAQMVDRVKVQLYELNLQLQQASIDDQNVLFRRVSELTTLLTFYERRAARTTNSRPRFASINLSNSN